MQIIVELPDEIAEQLRDLGDVSRRVLEALAVEAYRLQKLSRYQLSQLLQLDYWQTEELLERCGAKRPYGLPDLEIDRQSLGPVTKK